MTPDQVTMITCANLGEATISLQHSRMIALPGEDLVARPCEEIEAPDFWGLHAIDPQMLLRRGGHANGAARQMLFCRPRLREHPPVAGPAAARHVIPREADLSVLSQKAQIERICDQVDA
jgi:hypothetical protein